MEIEEKLKVQAKLIQDLNQENDQLKKQVSELEVKLSLSSCTYDESMDKAKNVILAAKSAQNQYEEATKEAGKIKLEYEECLKEIYKLKTKYKSAVDNVIKEIKK